MKVFDKTELKKLFVPKESTKNGQVTIIGGSELFHGAPILALKVASRIVDMVFFATPTPSVGGVAEQFKSKLFSFIWIPWDEADAYIEKSDSVLIGPGFMRFGSEKTPEDKRDYSYHEAGKRSREITERLLKKFPDKRWVIDGGSLQVMDVDWIPKNAILTPNEKEYRLLFNDFEPQEASKKYNCVINAKGVRNVVYSPDSSLEIPGGNPGLTKGGVGDVLAGLTVALYAKNEAFLAACSASYFCKASADEFNKKIGPNYNADDLADKIPEILHNFQS
jgi:NAD(P)H-hydrate epimerase